jgi:hypothetical protein
MGFLTPKAPAAPPPPQALPLVPQQADANAQVAGKNNPGQPFGGTLMTSAAGLSTPATSAPKSLLGQ